MLSLMSCAASTECVHVLKHYYMTWNRTTHWKGVLWVINIPTNFKGKANCSASCRVHRVNFIGEIGDDFGGLTKDLFTSLWVDIIRQFFIRETAVVPFIPVHEHMRKCRHFEAIGRILAHTLALLQYVPARLSRCTLISLSLDASRH